MKAIFLLVLVILIMSCARNPMDSSSDGERTVERRRIVTTETEPRPFERVRYAAVPDSVKGE